MSAILYVCKYLFVFPIMLRQLHPSGRSFKLEAGRRRFGGRTRAEQTQDAGVMEAGHRQSGRKTRALCLGQDAGRRGVKLFLGCTVSGWMPG